jgi:argininosuccinate lyase
LCEKSSRQLHELSDDEFRAIHPSLDGGVREVLNVAGALSSRRTAGGTAPALVAEQIKCALDENARQSKKIADKARAFSEMMGA